MTQFLAAGGPFMWPILMVGAVSVLYAVAFAGSLKKKYSVAAVGTALCTCLLALLSLATGFQFAAGPAAEHPEVGAQLILLGVAEAMNGVDLALLVSLATTVLVTAGAYRRHRNAEAEPAAATDLASAAI